MESYNNVWKPEKKKDYNQLEDIECVVSWPLCWQVRLETHNASAVSAASSIWYTLSYNIWTRLRGVLGGRLFFQLSLPSLLMLVICAACMWFISLHSAEVAGGPLSSSVKLAPSDNTMQSSALHFLKQDLKNMPRWYQPVDEFILTFIFVMYRDIVIYFWMVDINIIAPPVTPGTLTMFCLGHWQCVKLPK